MIRKQAVRAIPITPAGSVFPVKRRRFVAVPAAISQPINAASVRSVPCIVLILNKRSVL